MDEALDLIKEMQTKKEQPAFKSKTERFPDPIPQINIS